MSDGLLEGFLSRQRGKMADRLIPAASRRGRLLDLGCGEQPRFLMSTDFAEKVGVDRIAGNSGQGSCPPTITRIDGDVETMDRLPFDDDYFDIVTMLAVFEHIEPKRLVTLIADIRRVIRPGGLYILTTPAAWTDRLLQIMATLKLVNPVLIAEHKDTYNPEKIAGILQRGGFARGDLRFGYFEIFMNIWATAAK